MWVKRMALIVMTTNRKSKRRSIGKRTRQGSSMPSSPVSALAHERMSVSVDELSPRKTQGVESILGRHIAHSQEA